MKFQIGEMTVGDILDRGLKLLINRLPTFFAINLIVQTPLLLYQILLPQLIDQGNIGALFFQSVSVVILALILTPIGSAAILHVIAQGFIDRQVGLGDAFQFAFTRFWTLTFGSIIFGLVLGFGIILCIFPMFIFLTWYIFFGQCIVVEKRGAIDSFNRSKALSEGFRLRILGVAFLLGLLQLIFIGLASVVLQRFFPPAEVVPVQGGIRVVYNTTNQLINVILSFPFNVLVGTYASICITLLYFDLRIRKEGFDLELAAQQRFADQSHEA